MKLPHENCEKCGRWRRAQSPFIPCQGKSPADIFFIGQEPGKEEDAQGQQFVGPSGKELWAGVKSAGLEGYDIAIQNSVRCGSEPSTAAQVKLCRPLLEADIAAANPKLIMPLGNTALNAALKMGNITMRRGTLIKKDGRLYLPSFHPAAVLRDGGLRRPDFLKDLSQARKILDDLCGKEDLISALRSRYTVVMTKKDALTELEQLYKATVLFADTEFAPLDYLSPDLICLGMSFSVRPGHGVFFPCDHPESPFLNSEWLRQQMRELFLAKVFGFHNAEPDVAVIERYTGIPFYKIVVVFDSMAASICLHGPEASNALKTHAYTEADTGGYERELEKYKEEHPVETFKEIPLPILGNPYACGDTDTTCQISLKWIPQIRETGQERFYYGTFLRSYKLNLEMKRNGVLVDWEEWNKRFVYFTEQKAKIYEEVLAIPAVREFADSVEGTGKDFSLRSSQQMNRLLFEVLKLQPSGLKTEKGKDSLSAESIKTIRLSDNHPILDCLLRSAKIGTYLQTFVEGVTKYIYPDGFLHPDHHNFVASGRRGTSKPNCQNWPEMRAEYEDRPEEDPYNIRMMYRARPGYLWAGGDYAQLELRLAANVSQDPVLIAGCNAPKGEDLHSQIERQFKIPRRPAKVVNFTMLYLGSAATLQSNVFDDTGLVLSLEFCENLLRQKWKDYNVLNDYIAESARMMKRLGYVVNLTGHRRHLPILLNPGAEKWQKEEAIRKGWNHEIQGPGHTMLDTAMHDLFDYIKDNNLPWYIAVDMHDGMWYEVPKADIPKALEVGKKFMEEAPYKVLPKSFFSVPILAEMKSGTHLGNMREA